MIGLLFPKMSQLKTLDSSQFEGRPGCKPTAGSLKFLHMKILMPHRSFEWTHLLVRQNAPTLELEA
jgi:hypothetical protein